VSASTRPRHAGEAAGLGRHLISGSDAKNVFATSGIFAVPDKPTLLDDGEVFDLGMKPAKPTEHYAHALHHADWRKWQSGCVFYPGNEWTVQDVLADLQGTAAFSS